MVVHGFVNTAGRSLFKSNFSFSFYKKAIQPKKFYKTLWQGSLQLYLRKTWGKGYLHVNNKQKVASFADGTFLFLT